MLPQPAGFRSGDGVLLIGHGTQDRLGTDQFFQLGRRLEQALGGLPVQACLLERQSPTIEQGWQRLMASGVRRVLAAPLLLFAAGHAKQDIPAALAACQRHWAGSDWLLAGPLSRAPEVISLAAQRLDETVAAAALCAAAYASETAVVVVGRGNRDPCAQADLRVLTECVVRRRRPRLARTAFYAMASPTLPQVLDDIASTAGIRQVLVMPHLLFAGAIDRSIAGQLHQAAERHPQVRFHAGRYLGPDARIAAAIARRLAQVSAR